MSQAILLIEDDDHISQLVKLVLDRVRVGMVRANNGLAALSLLERGTPSLILLDMHMPKMNGHEFLEAYLPREDAAPIVIITVDPQALDSRDVSLVTDVLIKPFTVDELVGCVRKILQFS